MASKTIKSDKWTSVLSPAIIDMYGDPNRSSDVEIHVEQRTFKCHRLILALQSDYFKERFLRGPQQSPIFHLTLRRVVPDDFQNVLQYLHTGEIELDSNTVGRTLRLAKSVQLDDVVDICVRFMVETLDVETCVQYWQAACEIGNSSLDFRCLELFLKRFVIVTKTSRLEDIAPQMLKAAVERDDLNVNDEVEVCDVLLKWIDIHREDRSISPLQLLSLVRWSGVNIDYIKSMMNNNELLIDDRECFEFLSRVISFRATGIQFPVLRTRHRPSTGIDTVVVIIGVTRGDTVERDSFRFSLNGGTTVAFVGVPTELRAGAVASATANSLYVSGMGADGHETWRWDSTGGAWTRCGDLIQRRRRHCAAFVDETTMYALGGWLGPTHGTLSSVEKYSTTRNRWTSVGDLAMCVHSAGCVAHRTSVYVFGGCDTSARGEVSCVDSIQQYETTTEQCTVLTRRLDRPRHQLSAVLWDDSVILMNRFTCMVFDLKRRTVQTRSQFSAGVSYFGFVLDDQTAFVIGGGTCRTDMNGERKWTYTDQVKSIPIKDIIDNQRSVNWTQHPTINSPSLVQTFSMMTLATIVD